MKFKTIIHCFLFLYLGILFSFNIQAQSTISKTLHVEYAGTLFRLIGADEQMQISNLTLTGNLNGDDIRFIREMAGSNSNGVITSGNLSILDISNANIVEGGYAYYNNYLTFASIITC